MEIKRPIGEKGQVVIPKDIRNFLELEKGNNVLFLVENNEIKIKKDPCSPIKQPEPQQIEEKQKIEIETQEQISEIIEKPAPITISETNEEKQIEQENVESPDSTFSPKKILKNFFDSSDQTEQINHIKKSVEADPEE
jgi:AbrB family looped-hinge helix DNA binding protein